MNYVIKPLIITMITAYLMVLTAAGNFSYKSFLEEIEAQKLESCRRYQEASDIEAAWILSLQQEDGEVFLYEPDEGGDGYVNPYFACQAMLGVISDGKEEHIEAAGRYLGWHSASLISEGGLISDYEMDDGKLISMNDADSFDSYAAEYLLLLCEFLERSDNDDLAGDWKRAVSILSERFDEVMLDDVTYVNRKLRIAYLMDNAEVAEAAGRLGILLTTDKRFSGDKELKVLGEKYLEMADIISASIEDKYYLGEGEGYTIGIYHDGENEGAPDFSDFYPDAVAQLYPAITGVCSIGDREQALYNKVCAFHNWSGEKIKDTTFEWSVMSYAAAVFGDRVRLDNYLDIYEKNTRDDRSYPMHTANAGWVMRACNRAIEDINSEDNTSLKAYIKWLIEKIEEG